MRYCRCLFFIGGSMRHQIEQLQRLQQQLEALNNIMAQLDNQRPPPSVHGNALLDLLSSTTNEIAPPSKLFAVII